MSALRGVLVLAAVAILVAVVGLGMGGPPKSEDAAPAGAALAASKQRLAQGNAMVKEGRHEFAEEGCDTCHAIAATGAHGNLGPRLDTLADDDAAEIAENIVEPRKDIVGGYEGKLMPTDYGKRMDKDEVAAVAAFIKAVSGEEEKKDGDEG